MVNSEHSVYNRERPRFESRSPYQFAVKWAEELLCSTGVYVRRWYIETPLFSLRLHHWLHSDDSRNVHDHQWWFVTGVIKGSYVDVSPEKAELMTPGTIRYRRAQHRHTVQVVPGGCWTLMLTGSKVRKWGFWIGQKFMKANKYFLQFGRHICD